MHIHELNPKKTLIAFVIFAVVIIAGLITLSGPRLNYSLSPEETIELVAWDEGFVFPYELEDVLVGAVDTVIIVDIRNTFEFSRGHIPGSENISAVELISEENIKRLKKLRDEGVKVVIYGETLLQANGPYMVLRQIGFDNVSALMGGYNYYANWKDNLADSYADDGYLEGAPDFDYSEEAANVNFDVGGDSEKQSLNITRRKKSTVVEGGC